MKTDSLTQAPLVVIYGEDEYSVKERSREIFNLWTQQYGQSDAEVIEATAANSGEVEKILDRMEGALLTLPFFGGCKLVWLKNCNFMGEDRVSDTASVTERLKKWVETLKDFNWTGVRLLISSGKMDTRRVFFKAISKLAAMEEFEAISSKERGWEAKMELWINQAVKQNGKKMDPRAVSTLILFVGANLRQMSSELEKLVIYVGGAEEIIEVDVVEVVTRNKQSKSFALTDAIGERDLPRAIRLLDSDLAEVRSDRSMSEVGILYGIISKVRLMLILRELVDKGYVKPGSRKIELPEGLLPEDRKFNPALMNPYMVSRALPHAMKYSVKELVHGMKKLVECNRMLVYSGGDPALALQQVLMDIIIKKN